MGADEALGYAIAADLTTRQPRVAPDNLLAGMPGSSSLVQLNIGGLCCPNEPPARLLGTPWEAEARQTIALWHPRTTGAQFAQAVDQTFTPQERTTLNEPSIGWGGGWGGHCILGYDRPLREGISGLTTHVQTHLQRASQSGADAATLAWYLGLLHVCSGISSYIANHAKHAQGLATQAADAAARAHYEAIAETCRHIATQGARNFRDAVQLFWFLHVLDDVDSPGRIDQFLYPWYAAISTDPAQRYAAARPILESLWQNFIACRSWNVCLGGQTADGQDACNELTWLFLDLQAHFKREAPNLSVRIFAGSPPKLMQRCVEVISQGSGLPALYNDEILVPSLTDLGIPIEHARNYALNGCMQVDIQGMSHMGLEDGEVNLAKCLELALHAGKSPISGQQAGLPTLPVSEIADFQTLQAQLQQQIEYCAGLLIRSANLYQATIARTGPHLFRSLFLSGCVEAGRDMKRGGACYNNAQFLTEGLANTGDSLYAISRLVFGERRLTLAQFVQILDANWEGHETLRQQINQQLPRYGNDCDDADAMTVQVLEGYFRYLKTQHAWRGGIYSGGLSVFDRGPRYGQNLAASADGRARGEIVADSCGPARGRDRRGPTAMLKSAAKLPQRLAASGLCLNLKLSPSVFTAVSGAQNPYRKIAALFDTYFQLGGQQLQVNVVDAATLRSAQAHPENFQGLIVRVGGFSARFVDLGREQQDDIIARTEHC